jgi:hypothetical protein
MAPVPKPVAPAAPPASLPPAAAPTPATSFPTAACGPHIAAAITAVAARTQAAPELVAHHLLTLAAMAAQRLIGIRLPTGRTQPVSTYFLTIAGSGEGRSAAENMCVGPVRFWQQRFAGKDMYRDEKGRRLERHEVNIHIDEDNVTEIAFMAPVEGSELAAPTKPFECDEIFLSLRRAGVNDRYDRYGRFGRRSGPFAGVAADLLTPSIARRNEADSLSALWDGGIVVSGGEDTGLAPRLSVHLVTAFAEGLALLRAPEVADSGLLGRMLAVQPASRIGLRDFVESDGAPPPALEALHARLTDLYAREATCETRVIALDVQARLAWLTFAKETEAMMAPDGAFAPIRALAGRLAEHAARLAAIIALLDEPDLAELTPPMLERGIALARFYAHEALRLSNLRGPALAEDDPLAALQAWLERKYVGKEITLREVYCYGPPVLRSATLALRAMRQLEVLGTIEFIKREGAKKGGHWMLSAGRDLGVLQPTAA